jgi:K+-transporting ATPase ATPase C chain
MKAHLLPALKMTLLCLVFFVGLYSLVLLGIAQLAPNQGKGQVTVRDGKVVGYTHVGQSFTQDRYFNSRPSAVGYNAAGSGGSNKGPSNPDYLAQVQARIDTFRVHNPGIANEHIPVELVTASGSGLDPHLSPAAALIQVPRIAKVRNLPEQKLKDLVTVHIQTPILGPQTVNVLELNLALDGISN